MYIRRYHDALKWLKVLGVTDDAITTSCSKMVVLLLKVILEGRGIGIFPNLIELHARPQTCTSSIQLIIPPFFNLSC